MVCKTYFLPSILWHFLVLCPSRPFFWYDLQSSPPRSMLNHWTKKMAMTTILYHLLFHVAEPNSVIHTNYVKDCVLQLPLTRFVLGRAAALLVSRYYKFSPVPTSSRSLRLVMSELIFKEMSSSLHSDSTLFAFLTPQEPLWQMARLPPRSPLPLL